MKNQSLPIPGWKKMYVAYPAKPKNNLSVNHNIQKEAVTNKETIPETGRAGQVK